MSQAKAPSEREKRESVAVARRKAAKPIAETEAQPKRTRSKPVDIPKPREVPKKLTPKQKNEALKLKLQQLLEEL